MKRLLLMLLVLISGTVFGQYTTTTVRTNTVSTSKMIYNYQTEEWDFVSNNDQTTFVTDWTFNITDYNTGMISNGTVNYDILEYKRAGDAAYVKVYNTKAQRNMEIVVKQIEGGLGIVVFDKTNRTSFYFFP